MINEKCTSLNSKRKLVEVEQNYLTERNMMSDMDSNIRSHPNENGNILFSELGNA